MKNIDKYRGCLIGGAVGDALGYAVEFMEDDEIFEEYGSEGEDVSLPGHAAGSAPPLSRY